MYILWAIIGFGILVLCHELGHFLVAKANGVKVEEFSIGMGPKLISIRGKAPQGEEGTKYSIRILPIGGYNKMMGEEGESSDPRAFSNKSPIRKLSIIAAGPLSNFILAVVLFAIVNSIVGIVVPVIDKVIPNTPAQSAGIKPGDKIISINDKNIKTWDDLQQFMDKSNGSTINITLSRNGKINSLKIAPVKQNNKYILGVYPSLVKPGPIKALGQGITTTGSVVKLTFGFFKTLFQGKASYSDFGGPISIIKISGSVAKLGILNFISFIALLSIQLAIFNIIPFPALDGGYIFLYLFEIITRKHVDPNKVGMLNYIGFILLMLLMVLVTIKDVLYPVNF